MQTVTLEITHANAKHILQNLAIKNEIRIIEETDLNTPALPGKALNLYEFREWISKAETAPTISLKAAKTEWTARKKRLQQLAR